MFQASLCAQHYRLAVCRLCCISKQLVNNYLPCNACSSSPLPVGNPFLHNIFVVLCRRPTLLFGEPGLEKDNIAAQIHYRSSKHQEWPIVRFDCSKLDSYGSQLFGRGSKQGLLHWVGQGTLLLTNVHKVRLTCWLTLQTSALTVSDACMCSNLM